MVLVIQVVARLQILPAHVMILPAVEVQHRQQLRPQPLPAIQPVAIVIPAVTAPNILPVAAAIHKLIIVAQVIIVI